MCFGGGGDGGAAAARAREEARQRDIRAGATSINSTFDDRFNDAFYAGIEDAYLQYAQPDFERQRQDAQRELALALATSGNSQSSLAAQRQADLSRQIQQAELQLADNARGYANDQRNSIESARSSLLSQNTAAADPTAAANNARTRAEALGQTPSFSPLGQLLESGAEGLATQRDLEDQRRNRFNLFNTGGSSGGGSGKRFG